MWKQWGLEAFRGKEEHEQERRSEDHQERNGNHVERVPKVAEVQPRPSGSSWRSSSSQPPIAIRGSLPSRSVLRDKPFVGFVLITDPGRAKDFYCGILGLTLQHEDEFAVVVDASGTSLRLAVVPSVPEPTGTNAGWLVDDVTATVKALTAAGVSFERFEGMNQDADGVWHVPGGGGVAWFRDPDGNRLSLSHPG